MDPLKYEVLRDEQRRAVENEQQRSAKEAAHRAAQQAEREKIKTQARREAELEKARGFERQNAGYDQRQREEAASQKREANRSAYLKVNDPREYARQERDKQIKDQRAADERGIKSRWERQCAQAQKLPQREIPGREQPEKSRENGDAAERKELNKWRRGMSDRSDRRSTGGRTTTGSRLASANGEAGKPDGPPCFRGQRFPRSSPTPSCAHPSCMRRRAVASDARATSHRQGRHSCFAICADIDLDLPRRPFAPVPCATSKRRHSFLGTVAQFKNGADLHL